MYIYFICYTNIYLPLDFIHKYAIKMQGNILFLYPTKQFKKLKGTYYISN